MTDILTNYGFDLFQINTFMRIVAAAICGGLIGLERGVKGHPAGLKTFSLVCMGATIAMVTNEYIYVYMSGSSGDTARMAAQVISGIGFLGAGTIIVTGHNQVKGLTTAAALWVTASIGIAIGSGFFFGAIVGLSVLYISSFLFQIIERKVTKYALVMRIYVEGTNEEFMLQLVDYFNASNIKVLSLVRREENKWYESDTAAMIELHLGSKKNHECILNQIRQLKYLRYIEEL